MLIIGNISRHLGEPYFPNFDSLGSHLTLEPFPSPRGMDAGNVAYGSSSALRRIVHNVVFL